MLACLRPTTLHHEGRVHGPRSEAPTITHRRAAHSARSIPIQPHKRHRLFHAGSSQKIFQPLSVGLRMPTCSRSDQPGLLGGDFAIETNKLERSCRRSESNEDASIRYHLDHAGRDLTTNGVLVNQLNT